MLWRQQPDDDIGIIRSTEVRFTGEAISGPFEQYDLSNFCTSENHAVKVGAYEVARRKFIEHTLRLQVRPSSFNSTIRLGDIVRVELRRESIEGQVTLHNYLYEVERINRNISGRVELDLTHFPVNKNGQSLLAMYVLDAEGAGFQLPTGRDNFECDTPGRDEDDDPIPLDPYTDPDLPPSDDFDYDLPVSPDFDPEPAPPGGGFGGTGGPGNPPDPLDEDLPLPIEGGSGPDGTPVVGDTLTIPEICPGMKTEWYICDANGQCTLVASGLELVALSVLPEYVDFTIAGVGYCPDPGQPDGYGPPVFSTDTLPVLSCVGASETLGGGAYTRFVDIGLGAGAFEFTFSGLTVQQPGGNQFVSFTITQAAGQSYNFGADEQGVIAAFSGTITKATENRVIKVEIVAQMSALDEFTYTFGCTNPI
jgi:hypothetical protein